MPRGPTERLPAEAKGSRQRGRRHPGDRLERREQSGRGLPPRQHRPQSPRDGRRAATGQSNRPHVRVFDKVAKASERRWNCPFSGRRLCAEERAWPVPHAVYRINSTGPQSCVDIIDPEPSNFRMSIQTKLFVTLA